jgi:ABC-type protease/lipase transport system fused ATPase/permease subunit
VHQLFNDLRTLREFLPSPAVTSPCSTCRLARGFLLLMFLFSPWLGLLATGGVLIQLTLLLITERKTMPLLTEATLASAGAQVLRRIEPEERAGHRGHGHAHRRA